MMHLDILLTIHATSVWNELGQNQGHCDSELSETGHRMARLLSARPDLSGIRAIFTSDLKRAYQTAAPLSERIAVPIVTSPRLREGNWAHHHRDPDCPPLPFDDPHEDMEALTKRALCAMAQLTETASRSPLLIVAHGGFVQCFLAATFPDRIGEYRGIRTALNHLSFSENGWRLLSLNDDAHLPASLRGKSTLDSG